MDLHINHTPSFADFAVIREKLQSHHYTIKYDPYMQEGKAKTYPPTGFIQELPLVIDTPGDYCIEILDHGQVVQTGLSKNIYERLGFKQLAGRFLLIENFDKC